MSKYKFEMSVEEWYDRDLDVHRGPVRITYEGEGTGVESIVEDFKDWLKACTFCESTIDKITVVQGSRGSYYD